jgi:hypothetical protein
MFGKSNVGFEEKLQKVMEADFIKQTSMVL